MVTIHPWLCLAFVASLAAQKDSWLREVAEIRPHACEVVSADLSADGAVVVALTANRELIQYGFEPWREVKRFRIGGTHPPRDIRLSADARHVVIELRATPDGPTSWLVHRLADGAGVEGESPELPPIDDTAPPALRPHLHGWQPAAVRSAAGRTVAVFRVQDEWRVWRDCAWRALGGRSPELHGFALTGDGSQLLLAHGPTVEVVPVAGGSRWSFPIGLCPNAAISPFGPATSFVAVDRESIRIADAKTRRILRTLAVTDLGLAWHRIWFAAASPDGAQVVVSASNARVDVVTTWRIALDGSGATELPPARLGAQWIADAGDLLLIEELQPGARENLDVNWVPANRAARTWTVFAKDPGCVIHPDGRSFVQSESHGVTCRDVRTGEVRASNGNREELYQPLAAAGDSLLGMVIRPAGVWLELWRWEDLSVSQGALAPRSESLVYAARAAAHAPRVALQFEDSIVVCDIELPGSRER